MPETSPSFTRGVFAGVIHDSLLFPFPEPLDVRRPDEAVVVRRLLGELRRLEEEVVDSARFDEEETVPDEVITSLGSAGLLALTIPREYGGLELSATAFARVFGALSAIDASLAVLVGVHCGLGAKAIVLFGTPEQKSRYLPALARGDMLAAYALTEPETGSDAQNIVTRAEPDGAGGWILTGRKIWIGNGHRAGVIVTFAQTPVERRAERTTRPTAFLVRPDTPGFQVAGIHRKLGIRGSTQAELRYDGVRVPAEEVLGQVGKGFAVAVHVLNGGRHTLAAGCTGGAKRVLAEMARYAGERVQFGHPLADFEITQRKYARLACDIYASEAMLGVLSSLVDRGESDVSLEAAIAKVFASEMAWNGTDELVQIAGGRGYCKPHPYERMLRDTRINRIFEGANEVLRLFIALNGIQGVGERLQELGSALRAPLRNWGLVSGYAAQRMKSVLGATATLDAPLDQRLSEHGRYLEKHVSELKDATERLIRRHRKEIIERQLVLERLANMAIELYATACVLARTQRLIDDRGVDGAEREIALCDLFCVESGRRFRTARSALDSREETVDDRRRAVAAAVRAALGYFVEDAILPDARDREALPDLPASLSFAPRKPATGGRATRNPAPGRARAPSA